MHDMHFDSVEFATSILTVSSAHVIFTLPVLFYDIKGLPSLVLRTRSRTFESTHFGNTCRATDRRNADKLADRASLTAQHEHQAGYVNKDPCKPAWELPM